MTATLGGVVLFFGCKGKVGAKGARHAVVLDSSTDRPIPLHNLASVLVQQRAGRLTQNTGERLAVLRQTVQTYVHLPELQVGEDTTIPVKLLIALEVGADVKTRRDERGYDLEHAIDGLHINEVLLRDVLRGPIGCGHVVET